MKARKLANLSVLISLALIMSYIETLIPTFVAVPGIKVGLANIAVVFALYKFGIKEAAVVSSIRILLVGILFGSIVSLAYSFSGAFVSFIVMILLKKSGFFSSLAVSVSAAVMHNMGQILAATLVIKTDILKYYVPVLIVSGVICGIITGLISSVLINRVKVEN